MKKVIIIIILLVNFLLFGYNFQEYNLRVTYSESNPGTYYIGENTENGSVIETVRFNVTLPDSLFDDMVFDLAKHIVLRDYVAQDQWLNSYIEIRKVEVITDSVVILKTLVRKNEKSKKEVK